MTDASATPTSPTPRRSGRSGSQDTAPAPAASPPLLEVRGLSTQLDRPTGPLALVRDVSFTIERGKTLALVGESGCGKSLTSLTIMRLLPKRVRQSSGEVRFCGEELSTASPARMRQLRGDRIAMIFQEPMTSLNPLLTIGEQITEVIRYHAPCDNPYVPAAARKRAAEMLDRVGIPDATARLASYPHELSGGMRQRVMIAIALTCDPALIIADEPTTALDVTIQAQILDLLRDLQREKGMGMLFITHDLGVVAEIADDVAVMYASRIVERAPVDDLFANPRHPYTVGLFESLPVLGTARDRLPVIPGSVPDPAGRPAGCAFHPRCPFAADRCATNEPPLAPLTAASAPPAVSAAAGRVVACHHHTDVTREEWVARVASHVPSGGPHVAAPPPSAD